MRRLLPILLLLLLLPSVAGAEPIWLRGRGERVWIERDAAVSDPTPHRKGFTRVATSHYPGVTAERPPVPRAARGIRRQRVRHAGVVFGPVTMRDYDRRHAVRRRHHDTAYEVTRYRLRRAVDHRRRHVRNDYEVDRRRYRNAAKRSERRYDLLHRRSHRRGRLDDGLD